MPGPSAIAHATGRSFAQGLCALDEEAVMSVNIRGRDPDENFGPESVSRLYPAFCSVTASGQYRRPAASSLFCFGNAALRVTVSGQILFAKCSEKISPEPP